MDDDRKILSAKMAKLQQEMEDTSIAETELAERVDLEFAKSRYDSFKTGEFKNLKRNRFRWIAPGSKWNGPDLFEFIPKQTEPFAFIRANGEVVVPKNMITDVGSIPRLAGLFRRGLTSWGYAPAYIVHDWEFELHHCGKTSKSFNQVRDTMMECVKTLMEKRLTPKSEFDFGALYLGISSSIARRIWNRNPPKCTLPPENPE